MSLGILIQLIHDHRHQTCSLMIHFGMVEIVKVLAAVMANLHGLYSVELPAPTDDYVEACICSNEHIVILLLLRHLRYIF